MGSLSKSEHYQPDIQGLRAVAVILVIFYHSGLPGLPGGFIGVDVFFVISGYLITGLLLRELSRSHTVSLTRFYARRFRRLLPAATLVLVATITTAWFAYSPLALKQFSSSAVATAVYLSNVLFAHRSTDYLAEDTGANPLLHTWSLGVEEQFYLVWPLLLLLTFRLGRPERLHYRLMTTLSALALLSFLLSFWLTKSNQPWAFFGSPARAWEFAAGGLIALWFSRGHQLNPRSALVLGWIGLATIIFSATVYDRSTPFPGSAVLTPVLGSVLLIAAAHTKRRRGASVLLATRPMQLIGDMSYSLYLWHWPVFVFLADFSPRIGLQYSLLNVSIVFFLSWCTLVLVENPVRFSKQLSLKVTQSLAFGVLLTMVSATLAFGARGLAVRNMDEPAQRFIAAAITDIPRIYVDACHVDQFTTVPPDCSYGSQRSSQVAVLFGDSHAAHWFPALERLATEQNWKLLSFTKSGCPSAMHEPYSELLGRAYAECTEWRENALDLISQLDPRLTFVSNSYGHVTDTAEGPGKWQHQISEVLARLAKISGRVVIISDTPRPNRSAPDCLSHAEWRKLQPEKHCLVKEAAPLATRVRIAETKAAAAFDNVSTIDLIQQICPEAPCPVFSEGIIKFSDDHHMTATYSRSLKPYLAKFFVAD